MNWKDDPSPSIRMSESSNNARSVLAAFTVSTLATIAPSMSLAVCGGPGSIDMPVIDTIARSGAAREYAGAVEGAPGVELVLLAAAEIPRELAAGRLHLGVTGQDLVRDGVPRWADRL